MREFEMVSDQELLGLYVVNGDELAFERLTRRHAAMVMHVCKAFLWNPDDCEDAFQSVFTLLSRKSKSLSKHSAIGGWLHNVAVNVSLTKRRSIARQREVEIEHELESAAPEPWVSISIAQQREKLHLEIARLPRNYRDVIVLCHLNGVSRCEAAESLDLTTSAVKAALARARKLLRQRLIQNGISFSAVLSFVANSNRDANASTQLDQLIVSTVQQILSPTSYAGKYATNLLNLVSNKGLAAMPIGIVNASLAAALGLVSLGALSIGMFSGPSESASPHAIVIAPQNQTTDQTESQTGGVQIQQEHQDPASAPDGLVLPADQDDPANDIVLRSLELQLAELQVQLAAIDAQLGRNHPSRTAAESKIVILDKAIAQRRQEIRRAAAPEFDFHQALAEALKVPRDSIPKDAENGLSELQKLQVELLLKSKTLNSQHPNIRDLQSRITELTNRKRHAQLDSASQQTRNHLAETQIQLQVALQRFGPSHPKVVELKRQIEIWKSMQDNESSATSKTIRNQADLKKMFERKPVHENAKYETPASLNGIAISRTSTSFDATDPEGRTLRRFLDKNRDRKIDTWIFFNGGVETYRDVDRNFDGKAEEAQFTKDDTVRIALDTDGDGQVDEWKTRLLSDMRD